MSKENKSTKLSWDDFVKLGNPDNAPDTNENEEAERNLSNDVVRIFLEKKHRGGKTASVIKGIDQDDEFLNQLAKKLKQKCGVGGNSKHGEIIIQGNHRDKIKEILM